MYRAQPYIQLEEVMKYSANSSFNRGDYRAKPKLQHIDSSAENQGHGQGTFKKRPFSNPQQRLFRTYRVNNNFTLLKLPIQDVFEVIKGQLWMRRPKPKPHNPSYFRTKDYCSFTTTRDIGLPNVNLSASTRRPSLARPSPRIRPRSQRILRNKKRETQSLNQPQHVTQYRVVD